MHGLHCTPYSTWRALALHAIRHILGAAMLPAQMQLSSQPASWALTTNFFWALLFKLSQDDVWINVILMQPPAAFKTAGPALMASSCKAHGQLSCKVAFSSILSFKCSSEHLPRTQEQATDAAPLCCNSESYSALGRVSCSVAS